MKIFILLCILLSIMVGVLGLRPIPSRPLKVTYINGYYPGGAAQAVVSASNAGFNVIILSFYMTDNTAAGIAADWKLLGAQQQIAAMNTVHNNGGVVLVSIGGATDQTWLNLAGSAIGTMGANWVVANNLDGLDFDLEGAPGMAFTSTIVQKYTDAINAAAAILKPASGTQGVISAAPYGPWFGPIGWPKCVTTGQTGCTWVGPSGGMTAVYANVGSKMDYLFVQFYNQLTYVTQNNLFVDSTMDFDGSWDWFPQTAVKQIAAQGIPLGKIVIGKPVDSVSAAADGFVVPATLSLWILAQGMQCSIGGVGIWEWNALAPAWVLAAWPAALCPGSKTTTTTTTARLATTTTTTTTTTATSSTSARPSSTTTTGSATPLPTKAPTSLPTKAPTAPVTKTPTAAANPCASHSSGNWCSGTGGFVTCPSPTFRPCQAGLKCTQTADGVVYCL